MNLQGNSNIFIDKENATHNPKEQKSKVKINLENAKKIDREIPYAISREAYFLQCIKTKVTQKSKANYIKQKLKSLQKSFQVQNRIQ